MNPEVVGQGLSSLGMGVGPALIARARQMGVQLPAELSDPGADVPPRLIVSVLRQIAGHFFPLLAEGTKDIR
jgi:phospholipase C